MSEVKRLEMDHKGLPFVDENGVYVLYEDYAALKEQFDFKQNLTEQVVALQKQCDALAAENARMKKAIKRIFPEGVSDEKGGIGFSDAAKECYASATKNQATDVYLNSVRAEGVEMFSKELGSPYGDGEGRDYETGFNRAIEVSKSKSVKFVSQLRAGKDGE